MIFVVWSMDGLEVKVELSDLLNIYDTYIRNNCKNKRKILNYEKKKMIHLYNLYDDFNSNKYVMGNYNIFMIRYPKHRIVMSLNISDKIINHYVTMKYVIPSLEKYLDNRNIATRTGFGNDYGIRLLKKYLEINKKYDKFYILKLDIKKYFYNIDKDILYNIMKGYINDKKILWLTKIFIYDDDSKKEIPIGNYTSQYFANIYLSIVDKYIKEELRVKFYVRYMDDMVILVSNKLECKILFNKIKNILNDKLCLELNKKSRYYPSDMGIIFCGYKIYETHILIKNSNKYRIKKIIRKCKNGNNKSINDFFSYLKHADSYNFINNIRNNM